MDYYEILDISNNASEEEIRRQYRKLAKIWHPDKARQRGVSEREAERRFAILNEAYRVLSNPERRRHYDIELAQGKTSVRDKSKIRHTDRLLKLGMENLEKGEYGRAIQYFRASLRFIPTSLKSKTLLALAYLKDGQDRGIVKSILPHIEELTEEKDPEILYQGARVYLGLDRKKEAFNLVKSAHRLKPQDQRIANLKKKIEKESPFWKRILPW